MASVTKRGSSYIIRTSLGYDSKGKQIQKFTTWKPEPGMTTNQIAKELERQKVLFDEKCQSGRILDSTIKFSEFADFWMVEYAEKQLRPTTIARYRDLLKRINQAIGHIKLEKLQPNHLMEFYGNLSDGNQRQGKKFQSKIDLKQYLKGLKITQERLVKASGVGENVVFKACKGLTVSEKSAVKISEALGRPIGKLFESPIYSEKPLSGKTILHHHRLISSILEKAVKWQILFSNPCSRVEVPKVKRTEARYIDERQALELLECLKREPIQYQAIVTILLYSGIRRGELCGLEWKDIDFKDGLLDVNKTSLYLKDKGIFEDLTKTYSSNRVIRIPLSALNVLKQHKREQNMARLQLGDRWVDSRKIFTQWDGKPVHPDSLSGWFSRFVKKNNLPQISLHSLRHTNATLLVASGTDLRTISKRLGHSNMTTTANIYTHAIQTADERAAEALNDILTPKKRKTL